MGNEQTRLEQIENRISDFQDVISGIENLYTWKYTFTQEAGLALIDSNCPDKDFWHNVFITFFSDKVLELCEHSDTSILIGDDIGILWIVTPKRDKKLPLWLLLLGPVFTSDVQISNTSELLEKKTISISYKKEMLRQLERLPAISHGIFCILGTLQHFCATNSRIRTTDIQIHSMHSLPPTITSKSAHDKAELPSHEGAEQEALMLKAIKEGNLNYGKQTRERHYVVPGTLAPGNALRQSQDEIITEIALCSRAAIEGGLSRKMALMLSDFYIEQVEAAKTLPEVGAVHYQMREDYIRRVHDLKHRDGLSPAVAACMDYIELHITDRLSVLDVTAGTGHAGYYLSHLFQKEMKQSLSDYIQEKKIEYAAFLLKTSEQSVSSIAETLHFSSPNHLCIAFRKKTGMTPTQYRQKGED